MLDKIGFTRSLYNALKLLVKIIKFKVLIGNRLIRKYLNESCMGIRIMEKIIRRDFYIII